MGIHINSDKQLFTLHTRHTTYQLWADEYGYLHHLYYGRRLHDCDLRYTEFYSDCGFSPNPGALHLKRDFSLDNINREYTGCETGDFRLSCLQVINADGSSTADLRFAGAELLQGKYTLPGLPCARPSENCQTLKLKLADGVSGLQITLLYGVYENADIITRSAIVENTGSAAIQLRKAASACLDLPFGTWELLHFQGRHCMERQPERSAVPHAVQTIRSSRGASSHQHNPFVILAAPSANEDAGECYGAMLVYSGSFRFEVECSQMGSTRLVAAVGDERFCWSLQSGGQLALPEVLLGYSADGLTRLSHSYHEFVHSHICAPAAAAAPKPILLNSWEASYFDFTGESLLALAREAGELGMDMLVMDDGWFGSRTDDCSGLGDWTVNEKKLGCTLPELIKNVNALGLKFGIWVEPEMVNPGTELYKKHPEWVLAVPGRTPAMGRSQLLLDLSRGEVVDYLYGCLSKLLRENRIDYVKWDMNRSMVEAYSTAFAPERQGEIAHRYMLGLYRLLERLTSEFPQILFEGCSGGGGRFDAGMLYYFPQIWCSDDTDPILRLKIQYGTSFGYPISCMGSHVSASPNHQSGRRTPLSTRAAVAMAGTFGYELAPQLLSPADKDEIRRQIVEYRGVQPIIFSGRYYRLTDAAADDYYTAWQFTAADYSAALLQLVVINPQGNPTPIHLRLKGLDPRSLYRETQSGRCYTGEALMSAGYTFPIMTGDYPAINLRFERMKEGHANE